MFESLHGAIPDPNATRRLGLSVSLAVLAYVGLVAAALVLSGAAKAPAPLEEALSVVFAPPPPPPPPVPLQAPPSAPAVAAPAHLKRRPPDPARPPPPPPVVPAEVPAAAAPEADATDDAVDAAPPGQGDVAGLEGGRGDGPPAPMVVASVTVAKPRAAPIQLPENAVPPVPAPGNAVPVFPAEMRAAGREETVILKIVVDEQGAVSDVRVMRGAEPFASAAVAAVRGWRFQPATWEGRPIAVFKIVKVPFVLRL